MDERPEEQLPEPDSVRAAVSGKRSEFLWRLTVVVSLVLVWVAFYFSIEKNRQHAESQAAYCTTAVEIEKLARDELVLYQVPAGTEAPEEAMREQARQAAGRMVLLYSTLRESAPRALRDDIQVLTNDYRRAVQSDSPDEVRDLNNSEESERIDDYTRSTCS